MGCHEKVLLSVQYVYVNIPVRREQFDEVTSAVDVTVTPDESAASGSSATVAPFLLPIIFF